MSMRKWSGRLAGAAVVVGLGLALRQPPAGRSDDPPAPAPASAPTIARPAAAITGTGSCSGRGCHGALEPALDQAVHQDEFSRWLTADKHANAYRVLFSDESKKIAKYLGLKHGAHEEPRCLACHTNPRTLDPAADPATPAGLAAAARAREEREFGVGCESCHGPAGGWLDAHVAADWRGKSAAEKQRHGMAPLDDLTAVGYEARARACVGCHVGAPAARPGGVPQDMNHDFIAAGHPRLHFEPSAYLANLPPHWNPKAKKAPAAEARTWAVGQAVAGEAALALLADRAGHADRPWPEFAESDCYACHHDLQQPSRRQARGYEGRPPGALPWSTWYTAMPRRLAGPDGLPGLKELRNTMQAPAPDRAAVQAQAAAVAGRLRALREAVNTDRATAPRQLLRALADAGRDAALADWDTAEQSYLGVLAVNQDLGDAAVEKAVRALGKERAFPDGFNSPRAFRPDEFFRQLSAGLQPARKGDE